MSHLTVVPTPLVQGSILDELFARTCELFGASPVFERVEEGNYGPFTLLVAATIHETAFQILEGWYASDGCDTPGLLAELDELNLQLNATLVEVWQSYRFRKIVQSANRGEEDGFVLARTIAWIIQRLEEDSVVKTESNRRYALREEPRKLLALQGVPARRRRRRFAG